MRRLFLASALDATLADTANAEETLQSCAAKPADERLPCYDSLAKRATSFTTTERTKSKWMVEVDVSPIDDSKNVSLYVNGEDGIFDRFQRPSEMTLVIACRENRTSS